MPRLVPNRPLPPYTYVPGLSPHPASDPAGHSHGAPPPAAALAADKWQECEEYLFGFDLFNAGYYWEAHEAWEGLWHAHGRSGPVADLLKGLIKLAAAGVKVREGQRHGVTVHAGRAAELFAGLVGSGETRLLGLDLASLERAARTIAADPPRRPAGHDPQVVFELVLMPSD